MFTRSRFSSRHELFWGLATLLVTLNCGCENSSPSSSADERSSNLIAKNADNSNHEVAPLTDGTRSDNLPSADAKLAHSVGGQAIVTPELRMAALQAQHGEATAAHMARQEGNRWIAESPERDIKGSFSREGVELVSNSKDGLHGYLSLKSIGRAGQGKQAVQAAETMGQGASVTWERKAGNSTLKEIWQSGPLGLEHRVVLNAKPAGAGEVQLEVQVRDLKAIVDGESVRLLSDADRPGFLVTEYFVKDSAGKLLPGKMSVEGGSIYYSFDDSNAVYPVEVDPLVVTQQDKLLAIDRATGDYFGMSAALSADGTIAFVGASGEDTGGLVDNGAVYVFTRSAGVWTQKQKLLASDRASYDFFGISVSLSSDGNTALVGAMFHDDGGLTDNGAVYVYTRVSGLWILQQKLLASDRGNSDKLGNSVSLSSDGNMALVGAVDGKDSGMVDTGAAYVFTRSAGVWTQKQKLLPSVGVSNDLFGSSVALAGDGNTALVSASFQDEGSLTDNGAVYVFTNSAGVWTQHQKLLANDRESGDNFGLHLAISNSGTTALIGAPYRSEGAWINAGAAYVFINVSGIWVQQKKLASSDLTEDDTFGSAVSLSGDGNIALVGAHRENSSGMTDNGAAYVFSRLAGVWTQQQKVLANDAAPGDWFGTSTALSTDGYTALIGARHAGDSVVPDSGSAYVFTVFKTNGTACVGGSECASGFCVDGVCCNTACAAGECDACSVAAGSAISGTCQLLTGISCNDGNACTQTDSCQAGVCTGSNPVTCTASDQCHTAGTCNSITGACSNPNKVDGTSCNDGNACTQTDSCQSGVCTGANPVLCTASDQCHDAGLCNTVTGICSNPNKADGASCSDGNACTQTDTCQSGACVGGNPVTCTASDWCHLAGTCNPATGVCSSPNAPNGTICNDLNPCTTTDTCVNGACTPGAPVVCTPVDSCHVAGVCDTNTGFCTSPPKPNGASCDDSNGCTQTDVCQGGICVGGNPVSCTPIDQCHDAGVCDPASGSCSNPNKPDNTTCNDGDVCSQNDYCQNGLCKGGTAISCDDGNVCTSDTCDPMQGCQHPAVADETPCDDGNVCNVGDRCVAGSCQPTGGLNCDDNDPCTADSCDSNGQCVHMQMADGSSCSDGDACTVTDTCQAGVCAGSSLDCDDSNACTTDTCDSAAGCVHDNVNDGTGCTDGNSCTENDTCQQGTCVPGSGKVCQPNECQQGGGCDTGTGECQFTNKPDGTDCSLGSCSSGACVPNGTGGSAGSGGTAGTAGTGGNAGSSGSSGSSGSGGSSGNSGAAGSTGATAGTAGSGGSAGMAGGGTSGSNSGGSAVQSTGGTGGESTAGTTGSGANSQSGASGTAGTTSTPASTPPPAEDGGCGCRVISGNSKDNASGKGTFTVLVGLSLATAIARRRRTPAKHVK